MFGSFLLGYIIDDAMTEITLTVIVCFSSFMISESTKVRTGFSCADSGTDSFAIDTRRTR